MRRVQFGPRPGISPLHIAMEFRRSWTRRRTSPCSAGSSCTSSATSKKPMLLDPEWGRSLARGTMGIRLPISRFVCKIKMSQDKDPVTQRQVMTALRAPGHFHHPEPRRRYGPGSFPPIGRGHRSPVPKCYKSGDGYAAYANDERRARRWRDRAARAETRRARAGVVPGLGSPLGLGRASGLGDRGPAATPHGPSVTRRGDGEPSGRRQRRP